MGEKEMIKIELRTDDGERLELEISDQKHVCWQIMPGGDGKEERGFCQWNELESDLAEGMRDVGAKIVDAVQLWRDNFMLAN